MAPGPVIITVDELTEVGSSHSLKVATGATDTDTPDAPEEGDTARTVGGVTSGPTERANTTSTQ